MRSQAQITTTSSLTINGSSSQDDTYWKNYFSTTHTDTFGLSEFLSSHRRELNPSHPSAISRVSAITPSPQQSCTNIDFENGNLSGWIATTGYNPGYNSIGCCLNSGGAQNIMSGAGTDPCAGFPVVAPGGNFSVKLGNSGVGGIADRLEQVFSVTPANANFTYKYAVVFEDPGHSVADQPSFKIEMLDSAGNQIPCTYYNVAAGQGIPGFLNAPCPGVIYKPWSSVSVDLTNYIGQNVTIRFTTYDCALGGHYGYAYIDGSCLDFNTTQSGILCQGSTVQLNAPIGFATYNWAGPGNTTYSGQQVTVGVGGTYTVQMTTMTGCPGPTLTYNLTAYPLPNPNFTINQLSMCSGQTTFNNTSTISSGNISAWQWNMGNSYNYNTFQVPAQNYQPGTYPVRLVATSNMGCKDTIQKIVTVYSLPQVSFVSTNACEGDQAIFINNTIINSGYISTYQWQFGDGTVSSVNPATHTYTNSGTYNVTLTAISNNSCTASATQPVTIYGLPNVLFSATNVCDGTAMAFSNSTQVNNGAITNYIWDFNSDGFPDNTSINPTYTFPAPGNYQVKLTTLTNNNCVNSNTLSVTVYPNPVAQFTLANTCFGQFLPLSNQSTISSGSITSCHWDFGDNTSSTQLNPQHLYSHFGIYYLTLQVSSNYGCQSSVSSVGLVYPNPQVLYQSTSACLNQATQFNNQSTIAAGTITKWRWDFDNNGVVDDSTSVNPTHIYPSAGITQSRLQAVSDQNCVSQNINPVTVHYNPIADFIAPSTCMPDITPFTNHSVSTDGNITSYQWDFNGDNVIDNVSVDPSYDFAQLGSHAVKLEVQTQYGCTNTIMHAVNVNPKPSIAFSAQNNLGCPQLCVNFSNQSSIGSGNIISYQWFFGDNSAVDFTENPSHCYGTGNYDVTLKALSDSGCMSSVTLPNLVNVYPTPIADFVVTPSEVDITEAFIQVTNQAQGATQINYVFNDGTTKNTPDFTHVFNTDVAKTVLIMQKVVNNYGCRDSIIKPVTIKPAYALYIPNAFTPNEDGINDGFKAVGIGIASFKMWVFDRWGNVIFETDDINKAWDGSVNGKGNYDTTKEDVYVWKAEVTDVLQQKHDLIGHVSLIK